MNCDIVIIGAGLSGLYTAYLLTQTSNLSVVVVEAKDRVGGRTETVQYDRKHTIDIGAQWIGPPHLQTRLNKLIQDFQLKTHPQYTVGKGILDFCNKVTQYEGDVSAAPGFEKYNEIISLMDTYAKQISPEKPWDIPSELEKEIGNKSVDAWLLEHCGNDAPTKGMFDSSVRCLTTSEPSEVDMWYWLAFLSAGGGYGAHSDTQNGGQHETVIGGTQQISKIMAEKMKILPNFQLFLNSPVSVIEQNERGAKVLFYRNTETDRRLFQVNAKYVVLTVPPPMQRSIHFYPPLPLLKATAQQQMKMGSIIKCITVYKKAFWREKGLSGEIFTDTGPVCNYYDASSYDGEVPAIIGFIAGRDALYWTDKTQEERRRAIANQLSKYLGKEALDSVGYVEKDWLIEPFTRGGYQGIMNTNGMKYSAKVLKEPFGRVHFAGTETASSWCGYMEGALQSGERVSEEIKTSFKQNSKL